MRKRLSWDEEKVSELTKKADPYTMNQDHKNPPVEKYQTGDPSTWAEEPHMATPWKNEGRTETGHPAPAREAVVQARKLEDKAIKCITIAQRMLPGASDEVIEEQATDFMYLPEKSVMATLQRQSTLAEVIAKGEEKEEEKEEEKDEVVEAGKKEETTPEPEKKEEVEAGKKKEETTPEPEKKAEEKKPEEKEEETTPAPEPEKKAEEKKPEEEEKKEEVEAGKKEEVTPEPEKKEADLLDQIFDKAAENKAGAKKLSGIVKQASGENVLNNLWDAPPDVSKAFK